MKLKDILIESDPLKSWNPYKVWKGTSKNKPAKFRSRSDAEIASDMIASIDSKKFPQFIKDYSKLFPNSGKFTMSRLDLMITRFFEHGMIAREDKAELVAIIKKALK